jgi:hypothetical protein
VPERINRPTTAPVPILALAPHVRLYAAGMVVPLGCVKGRLMLAGGFNCAEAEAEELTAVVFGGFVCVAMELLEVELVDNAQV